jgi:hypothetical protein
MSRDILAEYMQHCPAFLPSCSNLNYNTAIYHLTLVLPHLKMFNNHSPSVLDYAERPYKENKENEPENHGKLSSNDFTSMLDAGAMYSKRKPAAKASTKEKKEKAKVVKRGSGETGADVLRTTVDWSCDRRKLAFLNAIAEQKAQFNTYNKVSRFKIIAQVLSTHSLFQDFNPGYEALMKQFNRMKDAVIKKYGINNQSVNLSALSDTINIEHERILYGMIVQNPEKMLEEDDEPEHPEKGSYEVNMKETKGILYCNAYI